MACMYVYMYVCMYVCTHVYRMYTKRLNYGMMKSPVRGTTTDGNIITEFDAWRPKLLVFLCVCLLRVCICIYVCMCTCVYVYRVYILAAIKDVEDGRSL